MNRKYMLSPSTHSYCKNIHLGPVSAFTWYLNKNLRILFYNILYTRESRKNKSKKHFTFQNKSLLQPTYATYAIKTLFHRKYLFMLAMQSFFKFIETKSQKEPNSDYTADGSAQRMYTHGGWVGFKARGFVVDAPVVIATSRESISNLQNHLKFYKKNNLNSKKNLLEQNEMMGFSFLVLQLLCSSPWLII